MNKMNRYHLTKKNKNSIIRKVGTPTGNEDISDVTIVENNTNDNTSRMIFSGGSRQYREKLGELTI